MNSSLIAAQTSYLHKCGRGITDEEYEAFCYVYSHTYNNMIIGGRAFNNGANFLYSDMSVGRNTYEKNIFYDTEASGDSGALKNNCGKLNMGINNVVHRTSALEYAYGGCRAADRENPLSFENYHNIYLFDNMDGFEFGRPNDRFYDEQPDLHHNIYWSLNAGDEELPKFPDGLNWYEWQATGNDTGSLWQDPLFEDISTHSYILAEDSPAWELGIEQIEVDNIGIQDLGKYLERK